MSNSRPSLFQSFFHGGFECSTHRRRDGRRLDLIASTQHDVFAERDYLCLQQFGIRTVRDGIRWHLIDRPGRPYDFSSVLPLLRAAQNTGTQVIWDLLHYGWPDDLDVFSTDFVKRFTAMVRAFAVLLRDETDGEAFVCPVNEPSFLSWAGGEVEYLNPFQRGRGFELKSQLIRAAIECIEAVWDVLPGARIVHCEPAIHIGADPAKPWHREVAAGHHDFQFQSLDLLAGELNPELGGKRKYIDIVGVNYYWNNQWLHEGRTLARHDPLYRPFSSLLREYHERYGRPVFVAETGAEEHGRAEWLGYIASEVERAQDSGVDVEGICLYPILNHPGWDNDRHCHCGLLDYPDQNGNREVYQPLAAELNHWNDRFKTSERVEFAHSGGD